MTLLLPRSAEDYRAWTRVLAPLARQPVDLLRGRIATLAGDGARTMKDQVLRYLEYFEWPARQMEYSFVIQALTRYAARWPLASILDVGTGPSSFPGVLAAAFGASVTGVDSDPDIAEGMGRLDLPGCAYCRADMAALPFPDASFDAVASVSVLEHAPRPVGLNAIHEMLRVVKPHGCVVLTLDYRALGPAGFIARLPGRLRKALGALVTGGMPSLARSAAAPRPYGWKDLEDFSLRFRDRTVGEPKASWAHLSLNRVRRFWAEQWQQGFHYDKHKGRDYTSIGVILSPDPDVRSALRDVRPETA